jgi:hypothetical protein
MDERDNASAPEALLSARKVDQVRARSRLGRQIVDVLNTDVRDWYERHRRSNATTPLVWTLCYVLVLMAVLVNILPFDTVQVEGRFRLIKPLNFTASFATYLAVMVIFVDYLRVSEGWKKFITWGISICIATAITCITVQAARGTTSHFNQDTPFDAAVSMLMDIADPVNSIFVFILLLFALQSKIDVSPPTRLGIVYGIIIFLVGGVVGGLMVFKGQSGVGVAPGGPGLPVLNWSTIGGDLRVAHFLGVHAIQILPIAGWIIGSLDVFGRSMRAKRGLVVAVCAGYAFITAFVFMQALSGAPFVRI